MNCRSPRLLESDRSRTERSFAIRSMGLLLAITVTSIAGESISRADDWPCWRGPEGNNHAGDETDAPLRWDLGAGTNIVWKTPIPGRGHSTPVVIEDAIFLTTADESAGTQSLVKLDRESGRLVDQWVLHKGTLPPRIHRNNSHASPTPYFNGESLFVSFYTDDAIWVTAMTTAGQRVWKRRVCDFTPSMFKFGYGASPVVEEDLVIIAAEYDGPDSGLYALDVRTGKPVWKRSRPINLNFASPIVATIAGRRQLLLAGANMIASYDPITGRPFWTTESSTEAICGTIVWDDRRIMISGGNPAHGTWCIQGHGSLAPLWENSVMCYEQSLLAIKNFVFAVADSGVAYCWRTSDGAETWRKRLFSGPISASPLLVDKRVYVASQTGTVYVIAASPERFDLLAENPTGDSIFASPVAVDDRLYLRCGVNEDGKRQEYLVATGRVALQSPSSTK